MLAQEPARRGAHLVGAMSGTRHTFHGADTASSKTFDRLADWATLRKELYADEVPAQLPHDTGAWKKSTGVGGYAPAGLAKDRSGAHDPCVATLESIRSPFPISRHTVKCTLRERCWSGEIFPTELLPMDNETVRFIGFTYFEQDGRALNHSEQESMMWRSAAMKFPCSRPASYQEYMDGRILGMPERNVSGCEIIFTGNPSRGDAPATTRAGCSADIRSERFSKETRSTAPRRSGARSAGRRS